MLAKLEFHQLEWGFHQQLLEYNTGIYKEIWLDIMENNPDIPNKSGAYDTKHSQATMV
jgi:hypothetical protein